MVHVPCGTCQSTRSRRPPGPKQKLLEAAISFLTERGVSELSLRELAVALGTSHRMLIYHFGSKEGLLVEVVRTIEQRERATLAQLLDSEHSLIDAARAFWTRVSDPSLAPYERLFFEVYGQGLQGHVYRAATARRHHRLVARRGVVEARGPGRARERSTSASASGCCRRERVAARLARHGRPGGRRRRVRAVPRRGRGSPRL